jgi:outer membrane protein assembly factor BamB
MPLYQKWPAIIAASLVLPPAGLVLLWLRKRSPVLVRILASVPIVLLGIAHLVLFYGLRMEFLGGMEPVLAFRSSDRHYRALERNRAAQSAAVGPATGGRIPFPPSAAPAGSTYWADFRGPARLGHYNQKPILTEWPAGGLQRIWKQPVGGGYASFTVAGGVAFTIEQRRTNEAVAAYDIRTGRERWVNSWSARFDETLGGEGPRATPVWDGGRVYALGAEGEFRCLEESTGKAIWRKNILAENGASNVPWGMAASPLILDDKVIVLPGGPGGRSVVAYNKLSGKVTWGALDDRAAYASPIAATVAGRRQILLMTANRAVGLAPEDGRLLWEYPWVTQQGINAVEPIVVAPNRIYFSSGYGHGAAVVELTPQGETFQVRDVWASNRMKNKFNGPVLHEEHIYGLDEGILACIDVETGDLKWKGGRYGYGQILLASGHLVVLTEDGGLVLVRAAPDRHHEIARFRALSGKTWNYPAISDGVLLVRNTTEMAAFRITPE